MELIINSLKQREFIPDFVIANLGLLFEVVSANLFNRHCSIEYEVYAETASQSSLTVVPADDDENKNWLLASELLLTIILSEELSVRELKLYVKHEFLSDFFSAMKRFEVEERCHCLWNILHRMHAKFVPQRKLIRKFMMGHFMEVVDTNHVYGCTFYLLSHYCRIASGFSIPLREENELNFHSLILPLLQVDEFHRLTNPFKLLLSDFGRRGYTLAKSLKEVLRRWPQYNS